MLQPKGKDWLNGCKYKMGWMPQPKDKGWLNGYKNKTTIYAVYKRPILGLGTHTDWKWGAEKRYSMQMEIDFKIKTITRDKEGHHIMTTGSI